jgi:predicted transcriptional regulator YdeE
VYNEEKRRINMKYEIIEIKERLVVGLLKKTTNEKMQAVNDIASLWQKFMGSGVYDLIKNKVGSETIGLYTDYEGDYTKPYNFIACCEVQNADYFQKTLVTKKIPAGKYAKFTIEGNAQQAVEELWQKIWKMDLDRLYSSDFEVYHNSSKNIESQIIDVYISIK